MNTERRKLIKQANEKIAEAASLVEGAKELLEQARDEEQEYYDNMPESFQSGEKGGAAQEAIDLLEQKISELDGIELSESDMP